MLWSFVAGQAGQPIVKLRVDLTRWFLHFLSVSFLTKGFFVVDCLIKLLENPRWSLIQETEDRRTVIRRQRQNVLPQQFIKAFVNLDRRRRSAGRFNDYLQECRFGHWIDISESSDQRCQWIRRCRSYHWFDEDRRQGSEQSLDRRDTVASSPKIGLNLWDSARKGDSGSKFLNLTDFYRFRLFLWTKDSRF